MKTHDSFGSTALRPARARWRCVLLLAACLLIPLAPGTAGAAAPSWQELKPEQQQMLKGLETDWNQLPEERRQRLTTGVDRWLQMTPQEREKSASRLQRWKSLDPERRERLKRLRDEFRAMSPDQRAEVLARHRQLRQLQPEQRERIRQRFNELRARPGGLEAECGMRDIEGKLDCLGLPRPGLSAPAETPKPQADDEHL